MTEPTITIPSRYRKTRMRGLCALAGCYVCGGNGEYLVNDRDDTGEPWDSDEPEPWSRSPTRPPRRRSCVRLTVQDIKVALCRDDHYPRAIISDKVVVLRYLQQRADNRGSICLIKTDA
ncbi:hypothetical protein [Amycolatopsis sp. NPDC051371]|uniref:hypothetical protein n=1 Tax=Amycolatopsis sp. NPDC051371 TaxID=3155800 RepID=UPI0034291121